MRAHNLSVAALLADNIYNFGELVRQIASSIRPLANHHPYAVNASHPILSRRNTTRMDQEAPFHFQRRGHREIRSARASVPQRADLTTEPPIPATKDLLDGAHRVGVQAESG